MEALYNYIKHRTNLSEQGWGTLKKVLKIKHFQKGEFLLKTGEISHSFFFIESGYCRAYYDYAGKTISTNFYFENEFVTNIRSMKLGIESEYFIQAEEDMKTIVFDKEKLYELFSRSVEIDTMDRKLMEEILRRQEEQAHMFKLHTAKERFDYMYKIQPQIIERIPLFYIASYLGISIETLRKIYNTAK